MKSQPWTCHSKVLRGTHGVHKGCTKGAQRVRKGCGRGAQGAREGRARGAQGARKGRARGAEGARKGRGKGAGLATCVYSVDSRSCPHFTSSVRCSVRCSVCKAMWCMVQVSLCRMHQLSITELFNPQPPSDVTKGRRKLFVDLFCGCGGASEGAKQAGYEVVLAVDAWKDALDVHARNHPEAAHVCARLPTGCDLTKALPDGSEEDWHLHGSPPCTYVSVANQERNPVDREKAVELVAWYLQFAIQSSATSWSMEQVGTPSVLECVKTFKSMNLGSRFDYEVIDLYNIGVPQHRRRLVAGSADVVSALRRLPMWHRCVSDVILFPRGTHIRNYLRYTNGKPDPTGQRRLVYKYCNDDESCNPITGPSHVVVAGHRLRWATPLSGLGFTLLSTHEMGRLQCFPATYSFAENTRINMRCIGNAIPPVVMYQMLKGRRPPKDLGM